MVKPDRIVGRGSQWYAVRKEALRRAPFCAFCGTMKRLQVHHIMPYRLQHDNNQSNLIPVCRRHHEKLEAITIGLDAASLPYEEALAARSGMLSEIQDATRALLLSLGAHL